MTNFMKSSEYVLLEEPFRRIDAEEINTRSAEYKVAVLSNTVIIEDILTSIDAYDKVYHTISDTTDSILSIIYGDGDTEPSGELNRITAVKSADRYAYSSVDDYRRKYSIEINEIYLKKFRTGLDAKKRLKTYIENIYQKMDDVAYSEETFGILRDVLSTIKMHDLNSNIRFINILKTDPILFDALKETLITRYFNKNKNKAPENQSRDNYAIDVQEEEYDFDESVNSRIKTLISQTEEYKQRIKHVIEANDHNSDVDYLVPFYKELRLLVPPEEYAVYRESFLQKFRQEESVQAEAPADSNEAIESLYASFTTRRYNNYLSSLL